LQGERIRGIPQIEGKFQEKLREFPKHDELIKLAAPGSMFHRNRVNGMDAK
jgi:hypothetical protein